MKLQDIKVDKILWVDDIRNPPSTIVCDVVRTYGDAITALDTEQYGTVYLDHDLGDWSGDNGRERTGYDVLMHIVQMKHDGKRVPTQYELLTANPVGRQKFIATIARYLS